MSTSVSPTTKPAPAKRGKALRRWVIGLSIVLLTLLLFIIIRTQGHVTGQEFAPTHFQQRDFSFYEIPILHLQITPIKRSGSTPTAAMYLRQNALIPPVTGNPDNWHLVSISRGLTGRTPRDAQLLLDQLELQTGSDAYWRKWSIDHAKQARVLWPVIQKLAERELYLLMPELFELAQRDLTPTQLARQIDLILRQRYHGLALDMQDADRGELARQLVDEALTDYPQDEQLTALRNDLPPITEPSSSPSSAAEPPTQP